jgi:HEAT repeat protein
MQLWKKLQLTVGTTGARVRAVEELARSKGPGAVAMVADLAARAEDPEVQLAAARALGKLGDPQGVGALVALLRRGRSEVQAAAAQALGQVPDPAAVGPLERSHPRGDAPTHPNSAP